MNVLRNNHLIRYCTQRLSRIRLLSGQGNSTDDHKLLIEPLVQRELIRVSGTEVISFLQGLTTNDMRMLESPSKPVVFTMFLNKAGRVMYDAMIYRTSDPSTILIECDKDISDELRRHLKLYRVRRNIQIDDVAEEIALWVLFHKCGVISRAPKPDSMGKVQVVADPRLRNLGYRLLAPSNLTHLDLSKLCSNSENLTVSTGSGEDYKDHRYYLGVAEGVVDLQPGKQFPLEANCDLLNGVSFNKGCYIGQELTARVHHTGVIRKRHMPLQLRAPLQSDSTKIIRKDDGTKVGAVLGNTAKRAIGLLRVEQVLKCKELFIDGNPCLTEKPLWWPPEVLSNVSRREGV